MKRYEIITIILVFAFGLGGALLYKIAGDAGEYIALFICIPPPIAFYLYGVLKNENPSPKGRGQ